jgi:hypothetical protein
LGTGLLMLDSAGICADGVGVATELGGERTRMPELEPEDLELDRERDRPRSGSS